MKHLLRGLGILAIGFFVFIVYRLFVYEQEKPFRHGMAAIKTGDYKLALELLEPYAARSEKLLARQVVGEIYALGLGTPIDNKTAQQWFDCAGVEDCIDGEGEYGAGLAFDYGTGVLKSSEKAMYWMLKSSHKGYKKADDWLASQKTK